MPEGLLDALSDKQAADLLAYLMKGKARAPKAQTSTPTFGKQVSEQGIKHSLPIAGSPTVLIGNRAKEITPDKKVAWEFFHLEASAHEVHVLATNGKPEGTLK